MLKEIPLLRAPENKRTGIEIKPNVKYPDQTEAAIGSPRKNRKGAIAAPSVRKFSARVVVLMHELGGVTERKSTTEWVARGTSPSAGSYQCDSTLCGLW